MSRSYILPVFALYVITSFVFLILFSALYYKEQEEEIYKIARHGLVSASLDLERKLRFADIEELENELEFAVAYSTDPHEIAAHKPKMHKFRGEFYEEGVRFHFKFVTNPMFSGREMLVDLSTDLVARSLGDLELKLAIIDIVMASIIALIAYFIVQLSYRPLLNQIKALNNFITDTTHEINTPLSVILMSVEMFEHDPKKYLENIKISAHTLSTLYSDLAQNLSAEPGAKKPVNISNLIEERVRYFDLPASKKNLKFETRLSPVSIISDENKIKKIVDNIISNAVKYSNKNETIAITLTPAVLTVRNRGVVIKKENLKKIYEKFTRFDTQNGGFGIGLSLVKRYCDELGFEISAKSSEEATEFTVKFA